MIRGTSFFLPPRHLGKVFTIDLVDWIAAGCMCNTSAKFNRLPKLEFLNIFIHTLVVKKMASPKKENKERMNTKNKNT